MMDLVKVQASYKVKTLVVGASNSGKTMFCKKHSKSFSNSFKNVIGVDIFVIEGIRPDGKYITLACWALASQERFKVYREQLFRGAIGAFVLFDLTNFQTFSEAEEWIKTIKEYLNGIPMVLIGNKVDLVKKRAVSKAEAENLADQMGLAYIEVSAKDNINVVEAFNLMNSQIYQYSKLKYSSLKPRHFNNNLKPKLNGLNLIN